MSTMQELRPQALVKMNKKTARRLRENVLVALQEANIRWLDKCLHEIDKQSRLCGYDSFILPIKAGCPWQLTIEQQASKLGLRTVLRWNDNGFDDRDFLPPPTAEELRALWQPLEYALQRPSRMPLDLLRELVTELRARGIFGITLPFAPMSVSSNRLLQTWLNLRNNDPNFKGKSFFFRFRFRPNTLKLGCHA